MKSRRAGRAKPQPLSRLEETLALHIRAAGLPVPAREYRFHPTRGWRADFAWLEQRLIVECEGGAPGRSRHTSATGYQRDLEKYNAAVLLGWRVLRYNLEMIESGVAARGIAEALGKR